MTVGLGTEDCVLPDLLDHQSFALDVIRLLGNGCQLKAVFLKWLLVARRISVSARLGGAVTGILLMLLPIL